MSDCITTYTGRHFDPLHPEEALICIEDIAHALSLICRGNGHVKSFFSVGQHCILCAREAAARSYSSRLSLAALLHDASECYMSDVPRPFKQTMQEYICQEETLLSMVYTRYLGTDLTAEEQKQIKEIDDDLLWYDMTKLLDEPQGGEAPELHFELDYTVQPFEEVEREYLEIFKKYYGVK